jgi:hypothetical protein
MPPFNMAGVIGKGTHQPVPGHDEEQSDLESGSFLQERDRNNQVGDKNNNGGDNPYLDEYRA